MKIALYKGKSWMSSLIKWQTRGVYSHAAVLFNDGTVVEAWQLGGQGVRLIKDLGDKHEKGTPVDIYEVQVSKPQYDAIKEFLLNQVGKKYDWTAIIRFLTKAKGDNPDKWICSELVFAAFAHAGIALLARTKPHEVSPVLLGRSTHLKLLESVETS